MPDNVTSMAYNSDNGAPWHGKGEPVRGVMTAAECIRKAGLDWGVAKVPLRLTDDAGLAVSGVSAVVRTDFKQDDRRRILGVVGDEYQPLQNWDAFGFFDQVVGSGKARYETAGVINGGKRIWLLAVCGEPIFPVRNDEIHPYMLLANGHDGRLMVHIRYTPIRVVCQNTLAAALCQPNGRHVAFRHDRALKRRLNDAAELFAIVDATVQQTAAVWASMTRTRMALRDAEQYFRRVFGGVEPEDGGEIAGAYDEEVLETLSARDVVRRPLSGLKKWAIEDFESKTNSRLGISGTLWAAYNAAIWSIDFKRDVGADRLDDLCLADGARLKERALAEAERVMRGAAATS